MARWLIANWRRRLCIGWVPLMPYTNTPRNTGMPRVDIEACASLMSMLLLLISPIPLLVPRIGRIFILVNLNLVRPSVSLPLPFRLPLSRPPILIPLPIARLLIIILLPY
jgi:hypothetical protein